MTAVLDYVRVEYLNGSTWVDMTSAVGSVDFTRGNSPTGVTDDLEIGTISVMLRGPAFAPATNPMIRARTFLRVRGNDGTSWQVLWSGFMGLPSTVYTDNWVPITTIPGFDVIGAAAETPTTNGLVRGTVATRLLTAVGGRTGFQGISRLMIGADDTGGDAFTSYFFPQPATRLRHLTIIRDSLNAWIWAARDRRFGTSRAQINCRSSANPPQSTAPVATFSDTYADASAYHYTDLVMSHDAGNLVNALDVTILAAGGQTPAGTYGSYVDQNSLDGGWPRKQQGIEVTDLVPVAINTFAAHRFRRYPLPSASIKQVRHDVMRNRALLTDDLIYQTVRVKHAATAQNVVLMIAREHHTIKGDRWHVEYDVRPLPSTRNITITKD